MSPGRYTELFFLDEVTALAAGHRPCFECRRSPANSFAVAWNRSRNLAGRARAADMDAVLHAERLTTERAKCVYRADVGGLPDGAMVKIGGAPVLVAGGSLWHWTFEGYRDPYLVHGGTAVDVLTPPSIVSVLREGYAPIIHDTAMI